MEDTIKEKAFSSIAWKLFERVGAQTVSFVVSIVLARILDPGDYSVVSIVGIFFTFSNVIISSGFNSALIQKKDVDGEDYFTITVISVSISVIVYIAIFLCAPFIAKIYDKEILISLFRVMGLILPINAIKSIVCAYISSKLEFKKFFFGTLGGTIFSGIIGVIMAINGFGAWSLAVQQMTNTVFDTVILIAITRVPIKKKFSKERFLSLFDFGWKILVSDLIKKIYNEINPLFIGLKFNTADLAFYSKGKSFPETISSISSDTLSAVLFPTLAKFQSEKKSVLKYTRSYMKISSFLMFPMMLGLFAVSDSLIIALLTEKWVFASFYVKVFCLTHMFDMLHTGNGASIKALGRSDVFLKMEIIKKASYFIIIGVFMFTSNSPQMLAVSNIVCIIVAIIINMISNKKILEYKLLDQVIDVAPNLFNSIIMSVIVFTISDIFKMNTVLLLIIQILAGIITYVVLCILTKNENYISIKNMVLKKKKI